MGALPLLNPLAAIVPSPPSAGPSPLPVQAPARTLPADGGDNGALRSVAANGSASLDGSVVARRRTTGIGEANKRAPRPDGMQPLVLPDETHRSQARRHARSKAQSTSDAPMTMHSTCQRGIHRSLEENGGVASTACLSQRVRRAAHALLVERTPPPPVPIPSFVSVALGSAGPLPHVFGGGGAHAMPLAPDGEDEEDEEPSGGGDGWPPLPKLGGGATTTCGGGAPGGEGEFGGGA